MPLFTMTKTYADGQVLTEQDLDNMKDSTEIFLNTTKVDSDNIQDQGITEAKLATAVVAQLVRPGMLVPYAGSSAPSGYLLCYGQEISQTTYAALFAIIGTAWNTGGEGAGNFRVPDLRGRGLFGKDNMGGSSANRITTPNGDVLGTTGGAESVTLTTTELPAHTHGVGSYGTVTDGGHTHLLFADATAGGAVPTANEITNISRVAAGDDSYILVSSSSSVATIGKSGLDSGNGHNHQVTGTSASTGTGSAFSKLPPLAIVNMLIKT